MTEHTAGLWRIEFTTDVARAGAPVVPLGFMLEAHWTGGIRWLGLIFRKKIDPVELSYVDLSTWPELDAPDPFMKRLFDEAWSGAAGEKLGAAKVADSYRNQGALRFADDKGCPALLGDPIDHGFPMLYAHLIGLRNRLAPTIVTPILPFRSRGAPALPDCELLHEAA